jgi:5-methylcytosine-specific restriction endonuclease McrA
MARATSYDAWRKAVLTRDGRRCVKCGSDQSLHADHVLPRRTHPELRLEIDNGRTLCADCHKKTDTFGGKMLKGTRMERNPYGGKTRGLNA